MHGLCLREICTKIWISSAPWKRWRSRNQTKIMLTVWDNNFGKHGLVDRCWKESGMVHLTWYQSGMLTRSATERKLCTRESKYTFSHGHTHPATCNPGWPRATTLLPRVPETFWTTQPHTKQHSDKYWEQQPPCIEHASEIVRHSSETEFSWMMRSDSELNWIHQSMLQACNRLNEKSAMKLLRYIELTEREQQASV